MSAYICLVASKFRYETRASSTSTIMSKLPWFDIYGLVSIANILTSGLAYPYTVIVWFSVWLEPALTRAGFFLAPDEKAKCTKLDPTKLDDYYRPFEVMYLPTERQEDDLRCYLKDLYALVEAFPCTHCVVDPNDPKALLKKSGPHKLPVSTVYKLATARERGKELKSSKMQRTLPLDRAYLTTRFSSYVR